MKTVVITGSARGLGFNMARFFRENDYNVVISDLKEENLIMAKKELEKNLNSANDIQLVDLAVSLSDYEDEEIEKICKDLNNESLAKVLEEAEIKIQKKIIGFLDNARVIDIFSFMSKDDVADVLGILNTGRRKKLINIMKAGDKAIIKELLGYKDDSAGRNNDY